LKNFKELKLPRLQKFKLKKIESQRNKNLLKKKRDKEFLLKKLPMMLLKKKLRRKQDLQNSQLSKLKREPIKKRKRKKLKQED
jgi:hypothetical protein